MGKRKIALALQGGGSHGAYTWGILERILEENEFEIVGFCGASSGAMNGAIATYGMLKGGNKGAIELLEKFWGTIGDGFIESPMQPSWLDKFMGPGALDYSFGYHFINQLTSMYSPYELDPTGYHTRHLKELLQKLINFDELRKSPVKIFASATNVLTSKPKIFGPDEMSIDALLASAALPLMYKAAKIDGEYYWDGVYLCNPQIDPLIDHTDTNDVLIVKASPAQIDHVPRTIREIHARISQISLHASLMAEMKFLHFRNEMIDRGFDMGGKHRKVFFHEVSADFVMGDLSLGSKFNFSPEFLALLRQRGRKEAEKWLKGDAQHVGEMSTLDIQSVFL